MVIFPTASPFQSQGPNSKSIRCICIRLGKKRAISPHDTFTKQDKVRLISKPE